MRSSDSESGTSDSNLWEVDSEKEESVTPVNGVRVEGHDDYRCSFGYSLLTQQFARQVVLSMSGLLEESVE